MQFLKNNCVNNTEDVEYKVYVYLKVTNQKKFFRTSGSHVNDTRFTSFYPRLFIIYEFQCRIVYLYRIAEYYMCIV